MAIMTRSTTTEVNDIYNIRTVLQNARAKLLYGLFGQEDELLERKGDTVKWYSIADLTEQTATLADSPTFVPETATVTSQTAQLSFYGNGVELTDNLKLTSVIDLSQSLLERIGYNAGSSIDGIIRTTLMAGTSVYYANGLTSASIATGNTPDLDDFIDVASLLEANDAPKFNHPSMGETYVAIISPKVKAYLMKNSAFRDAIRYGAPERLWKGEIASIDGVTFGITSRATTATVNSTTCDRTLVFGKGAYGVSQLPLPGGNGSATADAATTYQPDNSAWTDEMIRSMFDVVITPPGGHGDEYALKTAIAWKAFFASKILNQNFMYRLVSSNA
jgi:N4-gp56 family major capsid protein